jgi:hypothetical protein
MPQRVVLEETAVQEYEVVGLGTSGPSSGSQWYNPHVRQPQRPRGRTQLLNSQIRALVP